MNEARDLAITFENQRQTILALAQQLENSVATNSIPIIARILAAFLQHVNGHFRHEDELMTSLGYPAQESHRAAHRDFTRKLLEISESLRLDATPQGRRRLTLDLLEHIKLWIQKHFLVEDPLLFTFVMKRRELEAAHTCTEDCASIQAPRSRSFVAKITPTQDIEYLVPEPLTHLLHRVDYVVPQMPPALSGFEDFDSLLESAILRRIDKVLIFFQRHNPAVTREYPPLYVGSVEFAEKFKAVVRKLIVPAIRKNRRVQQLSTNHIWSVEDNETFWDKLDGPLKSAILEKWNEVWDDLRLAPRTKPDGSKVLHVKDEINILRRALAPEAPSNYDMPRIRNREIATFKSLLDTQRDWWQELNGLWQICHDLYEQEMDPRIFQEHAREGALRDRLLGEFGRIPDCWCDILTLTCYRVFPRVTLAFLESLARSIATDDASRELYLPYTMRFLYQARTDERVQNRERAETRQWREQVDQLREHLAG